MQQIIIIILVLASVGVVTLVLVQHGKGADAGASFGAGSSNTMFGSQGPMSFLMKLTYLLAAVFIACCLLLGYLASHGQKQSSGLLDVSTQSANPATASVPVGSPAIQIKKKPVSENKK